MNTALPAYRYTATGTAMYLGIAAAMLTVCIWSGWLIAVRFNSGSSLTAFDLATMRYSLPALLLLPFMWQARAAIRRTHWLHLSGISIGAGVPFFYLSSTGLNYAPVAHAGLLIPGTFPVFVTMIAVLVYRETLTRHRLIGLSLITAGVVLLMTTSLVQQQADILKGDLLLLGASFCWALFTVSMRVAGLPPLAAAGLLCWVSTLILGLLYLFGWVESGVAQASQDELILQLIIQALGAGLLAGFFYGFAINRLGAENTAAIGSLTPVVAGLAAIPLLGEQLSLAALLGMAFICFGVAKANGFSPRKLTGRKSAVHPHR